MERRIDTTLKILVDKYPYFGSLVALLYYVESSYCVDYNGNPTMATDGSRVYYHPLFVGKLTDDKLLFGFAHEICHIAFDHINRQKDRNQKIWNLATDAVINAFLKNDGMEMIDGAVDMPWAINYAAEEVYEILKRENDKNKIDASDCFYDVGHDTHRLWEDGRYNKQSNEMLKKLQEQFGEIGEKDILKKMSPEEKKKIAKKIDDKFGSGKMSNLVSDSFDDLGEHDDLLIDWDGLLKKTTDTCYLDWSYQNAYIEDGVVSPILEECIPMCETEIVLDTSSSIDDETLKCFLRECKIILEFSKIKVGCFDVEFYGFKEIKSISDIDNFEFEGRGGTDFEVAVKAFSKNATNKIIFTDGEDKMPDEMMDIIWVVFGDRKIDPLGGKVIYVDEASLRAKNGYSLLRKR